MFWSWSNSKIIGTPEKETIDCVLKSHRDYKYMYDYEKKIFKVDTYIYPEKVNDGKYLPILPILKLYWVRIDENNPAEGFSGLLTLGLLRQTFENYRLIGQDNLGNLYDFSYVVYETKEYKRFMEMRKWNTIDYGSKPALQLLLNISEKKEINKSKSDSLNYDRKKSVLVISKEGIYYK